MAGNDRISADSAGILLAWKQILRDSHGVTPTGKGLLLGGQPCSTSRGVVPAVPALPKFWSYLLFMHTHNCCRTTKFYVVTHIGAVRLSWGQPHLTAEFQCLPILGFFCIYAYIL